MNERYVIYKEDLSGDKPVQTLVASGYSQTDANEIASNMNENGGFPIFYCVCSEAEWYN